MRAQDCSHGTARGEWDVPCTRGQPCAFLRSCILHRLKFYCGRILCLSASHATLLTLAFTVKHPPHPHRPAHPSADTGHILPAKHMPMWTPPGFLSPLHTIHHCIVEGPSHTLLLYPCVMLRYPGLGGGLEFCWGNFQGRKTCMQICCATARPFFMDFWVSLSFAICQCVAAQLVPA